MLRDGPGNEKKAPVSFRSFTEVELFYANQEKVYDLSVEKLKGLVRGASDDVVRAAVLDIVNVVGDARGASARTSRFSPRSRRRSR